MLAKIKLFTLLLTITSFLGGISHFQEPGLSHLSLGVNGDGAKLDPLCGEEDPLDWWPCGHGWGG